MASSNNLTSVGIPSLSINRLKHTYWGLQRMKMFSVCLRLFTDLGSAIMLIPIDSERCIRTEIYSNHKRMIIILKKVDAGGFVRILLNVPGAKIDVICSHTVLFSYFYSRKYMSA